MSPGEQEGAAWSEESLKFFLYPQLHPLRCWGEREADIQGKAMKLVQGLEH